MVEKENREILIKKLKLIPKKDVVLIYYPNTYNAKDVHSLAHSATWSYPNNSVVLIPQRLKIQKMKFELLTTKGIGPIKKRTLNIVETHKNGILFK